MEGSYEEIPSTLIDYAKRDRRWCQGNLQHLRLALAHGFNALSRLHFSMGVMSYLASPLWLLFLMATGVNAYFQAQHEPVYFFGENWAPVWPVSFAVEMTTVLLVTLTMLFLPKGLALALLKDSERAGAYLRDAQGDVERGAGDVIFGADRPGADAVPDQVRAGDPDAPRRRLATAATRRPHDQLQRSDPDPRRKPWIGVVAGVLSYQYVPAFFWWFIPVLLGLVLAIPVLCCPAASPWAARRGRWACS